MNQITQKLSLVVRGVDIVAWISQQDSEQWVAIKPICQAMGIDSDTQGRKVKNDPKFTSGHMTVQDSLGRPQEMICIPVRQISGWLYGINSRKVSSDVAPVLLGFQEGLQVAMHEVLTGRVTPERIVKLEGLLGQALQQIQSLLNLVSSQQAQINQLQNNQSSLSHAADHLASSASYGLHAAKKTKQLRMVH